MIIASGLVLAAISTAAVLNLPQDFSQHDFRQLSDPSVASNRDSAESESITDQTSNTAAPLLAKRLVPEADCGPPIARSLIPSCREAFDFLPNTGPVISFGQRALKGRVDHVMPFFVVSSDGLCAISINITQPLVQREEETVNRVAEALNEVFARCILGNGGPRGGTVAGLGTLPEHPLTNA
ncbi:MAG: hypothetical protein LQ352_004956 [Teloschistes flavicans]|nr:MAG: hypothetical protein LQ352_004956 [Teloschistes flavicans]